MSRAQRIPEHVWTDHRPRIEYLVKEQKRKLQDVRKIMQSHGLDATISQYERKLKDWGLRKNLTVKAWRKIFSHWEERIRQGKSSLVLIDGVAQSKEKIERELARTRNREYEGMNTMDNI
ncbi:hypothetical protein BDW02DRAFT_603829 [Decorospora gaudefroyi]|uniref:Clr5 domain-containing protein n=1 Tax=Decorospora gaudefroyi TaxID=184978 RepID=A0A6A5JV16_9PLEO|nr:hypothetical protein BDW02DRAFT_603829 [Decorospora gaudefroyi]